jgi:hypothetical protein
VEVDPVHEMTAVQRRHDTRQGARGVELGVAIRADHKRRDVRDRSGEVLDKEQRRLIAPVQVVQE